MEVLNTKVTSITYHYFQNVGETQIEIGLVPKEHKIKIIEIEDVIGFIFFLSI